VGKLWKAMSDDEKAPWNQKAKSDMHLEVEGEVEAA
jgi:hypothetical protein